MHRGKIFMPRRRSCIASQYSCIAEDHVSRVNIHASRVNTHALWKIMHRELIFMHREKIFMPRRKLCIARRYSCLAEITHPVKICMLHKKSCTAREGIVHLKRNIYPSASTAFFYFNKGKHQEEHRRQYQEKYQNCISFYLVRHQVKSILKITSQTKDISFSCFTSNRSS